MNNLTQDENGNCGITTETKKSVNENEWNNIGKRKRNCPICNDVIYYSSRSSLSIAKKQNRKCKECKKHQSNHVPNILARKCPSCNSDILYSNKYFCKYAEKERKLCASCAAKGFTPHNKKPYDNNDLSRTCPQCNKLIYHKSRGTKNRGIKHNSLCHSCQNRVHLKRYEKISIAMREFKLNVVGPHRHFNKKACEYFDKLNEERGWKLQHAMNGGEIILIGYCLDAYDKNKNVVVEYDERHHYYSNGQLKENDVKRQQNIINALNNCDFYRYNEKTSTLSHVHSSNTPKLEAVRHKVAVLQNV